MDEMPMCFCQNLGRVGGGRSKSAFGTTARAARLAQKKTLAAAVFPRGQAELTARSPRGRIVRHPGRRLFNLKMRNRCISAVLCHDRQSL